ncbi:MAG: hypothetical protein CME71_01840 [Halobacteriovorax sp.]|nr:hypothetical protein [Halobacteriovorax sp.]
MNSVSKNSFKFMGVLNMTPDSFSDGGELLQRENLAARVKQWREVQANFIDLGAESTAPMNQPISSELEWLRLKPALELIDENIPISVDTYKSETIIKALGLKQISLWNDVSGQLDQELETVLKSHPNLESVFCHNLAPNRALTSRHMDYVTQNDIYQNLFECFASAHAWYEEHDLTQPYFDFCFGFSKTFEQNWQLLKLLPKFISHFEASFGRQKWIVAISRKSFLKQLASAKVDLGVKEQTEYMQIKYLTWLQHNLAPQTNVLVRLHDPALAHTFATVGEFL